MRESWPEYVFYFCMLATLALLAAMPLLHTPITFTGYLLPW